MTKTTNKLTLSLTKEGFFYVSSSSQMRLNDNSIKGYILSRNVISDINKMKEKATIMATLMLSYKKPVYMYIVGKQLVNIGAYLEKALSKVWAVLALTVFDNQIVITKYCSEYNIPLWAMSNAIYNVMYAYSHTVYAEKVKYIDDYRSGWCERDGLNAEEYIKYNYNVYVKKPIFSNVYIKAENKEQYLTLVKANHPFVTTKRVTEKVTIEDSDGEKYSYITKVDRIKKIVPEALKEHYLTEQQISVVDTFGQCDNYNNGVFEENLEQILELLFTRYGYEYFLREDMTGRIEDFKNPAKGINNIIDKLGIIYFASVFCNLSKIEELLPGSSVLSIGNEDYFEGCRYGEIDVENESEEYDEEDYDYEYDSSDNKTETIINELSQWRECYLKEFNNVKLSDIFNLYCQYVKDELIHKGMCIEDIMNDITVYCDVKEDYDEECCTYDNLMIIDFGISDIKHLIGMSPSYLFLTNGYEYVYEGDNWECDGCSGKYEFNNNSKTMHSFELMLIKMYHTKAHVIVDMPRDERTQVKLTIY